MSIEQKIFKKGSTTYYFSSLFFPEPMKSDVFKLYSFVRVADNYVDELPHQPKKLHALQKDLRLALRNPAFDTTPHANDNIDTRVVKNMADVARRYAFETAWIDDFFAAMNADITPQPYRSIKNTLQYVHGSAEVIGLMMARIMGLPPAAANAAAMQGRAMQFINFIRDIAEDNALGRQYLPRADLQKCGLADLTKKTAVKNPDAFAKLIRLELDRYNAWQTEAAKGFTYIPRRYRIPLRVAVDMYNWTGRQIAKDPLGVFDKKIKPRKQRVLLRALWRMIYA